MRILFDSHALYWWTEEPHRCPLHLQNLIRDPENELFFSPASIWELSIKAARGKLRLSPRMIADIKAEGIIELPITTKHAVLVASLPRIHDDPFDRMLIAQTLVEGLVLATRDATIKRYDVPTIEA